jgi:hypothetical protein
MVPIGDPTPGTMPCLFSARKIWMGIKDEGAYSNAIYVAPPLGGSMPDDDVPGRTVYVELIEYGSATKEFYQLSTTPPIDAEGGLEYPARNGVEVASVRWMDFMFRRNKGGRDLRLRYKNWLENLHPSLYQWIAVREEEAGGWSFWMVSPNKENMPDFAAVEYEMVDLVVVPEVDEPIDYDFEIVWKRGVSRHSRDTSTRY